MFIERDNGIVGIDLPLNEARMLLEIIQYSLEYGFCSDASKDQEEFIHAIKYDLNEILEED